ncbi:unnamed protein product [Discosporangium mesarthrocarpum]
MAEVLQSDPVPRFWTVCLKGEGGIDVDDPTYRTEGEFSPQSRLSEFSLEQVWHDEDRSRFLRVQCKQDGKRHIFREMRLALPERSVMPQLERYRELLLREARLLVSLAHDCIVPLRCAWLEQRTIENHLWSSQLGACARTPGMTGERERELPPIWFCVPWMEPVDTGEIDEENETGKSDSIGHVGEGSSWGGDGSTGWVGLAEPKEPVTREACPREHTCQRRGWVDGGCRTLHLLSYLEFPDFVPLSLWLEEELRLKPHRNEVDAKTATVPGDLEGWCTLIDMFLQVVRGVEHVHMKGLVHNNIRPASIWVSADRQCHVGGMSQVTCAGHSRPVTAAAAVTAYPSPEQRNGQGVDSHSDMFSLGILLVELRCHYLAHRGSCEKETVGEKLMQVVRDTTLEHLRALFLIVDGEAEHVVDLVASMLAKNSFERPDCFEVLAELGGP